MDQFDDRAEVPKAYLPYQFLYPFFSRNKKHSVTFLTEDIFSVSLRKQTESLKVLSWIFLIPLCGSRAPRWWYHPLWLEVLQSLWSLGEPQ